MRRRARALILVALGLTGCGDGGPSLVPITGKVTLDGKPLPFKSVRFVPDDKTPGQGAGANTLADGTYSLIAVRPGAVKDILGATPGAYRVIVTEPMFPIDAKLPEAKGDEPAPALGLPDPRLAKRPLIPAAYGSLEKTPLRVEVPARGGVLDLELKSK